jgi:ABC-2 type transport system permease protein
VIALATLVEVTLRGLLGRRRTILLALLALVPVGIAALARLGGGDPDVPAMLDGLVVRIVLPLIALVFGTAALGAEIEDGTAVYLLTKPILRLQIAFAKVVVAGSLTALLVTPSALLAGLLMGGGSEGGDATRAIAPAVLVGSYAYAAAFVAVSVVTTRALVVGLLYVIIWEGILAGILVGTKILSIREAVLGLAGTLSPAAFDGGLETAQAIGLTTVVLVGGTLLASWRLSVLEVRGGD